MFHLFFRDLTINPQVWPSFWTLGVGKEWPGAGEIDIIEGINLVNNNQMALHSTPGCLQAANPAQSGRTLETNCSLDRGCIVAETKPNSYGAGFAQAGGGVYAVQMDVTGVYIWFWSVRWLCCYFVINLLTSGLAEAGSSSFDQVGDIAVEYGCCYFWDAISFVPCFGLQHHGILRAAAAGAAHHPVRIMVRCIIIMPSSNNI